jgi:6-pyruvoyltetrahydropterin/6-carboxytetrahydropterin synthase
MEIFHVFHFEAAHCLTGVPQGHPCGAMHGHRFELELRLAGGVGAKTGMIVDFAEIQKAAKTLLWQLDHHCLNEVEGLENPTSENLARWFWRKLKPELQSLSAVIVRENPNCGAIYRGEDE